MSKQVYKITEAVHGELATPTGLVSFSIAAGEHEPADAEMEANMTTDAYTVSERVTGEYRARNGALVVLDYSPGESYTPSNEAEAEALAFLAARGHAAPAVKPKPRKAEETAPVEAPDATTTEE